MSRSRFRDVKGKPSFNIVKKKMEIFNMYYKSLLRDIMKVIKIKGLPETMPENDVKYLVLTNGYTTVGDYEGKPYAFDGEIFNEPNGDILSAYYLPNKSTVANAGLKFNKQFSLDVDSVLVKCDSLYQGFDTFLCVVCALLSTIDVSIYNMSWNARITTVYESGKDDITESINDFLKDIEDGEKVHAIASKTLVEYVKNREFSNASIGGNLKVLIELRQNILARFYMYIGLPSTYNMKRESLNENEIMADIFTLMPNMDDVIDTMNEDFEKVNKMFNTEISVEKYSALEKVEEEIDNRVEEENLDIDEIEANIEKVEAETEQIEESTEEQTEEAVESDSEESNDETAEESESEEKKEDDENENN